MKNTFLTIASIVTIFVLVACDSKTKITVKGANGTEYESYQECCAANDFEAAHQYLAKMQNENPEYKYDSKYRDAYNYVLQKEALFLVANGSEDAVNRLLFLIKEDQAGVLSLSEYLDLALSQNNIYLASKMLAEDKSFSNEQYVVKAIANNVDDIVDIMVRNNPLLIEVPECAQYYRLRDESLYNKLVQQGKQTFEQEMKNELNLLVSKSKFPIITKGLHSDDISVKGPECNERISSFNQECVELIHKAIQKKNKNIAESVLRLMKPNIITYIGSGMVDGIEMSSSDMYAQYVENDINEAKKIMQEAERSGAFN